MAAAKNKKKEERKPTFILELPLRTSKRDEKRLEVIFHASRQVYNACLGEALKRLQLLRELKTYQRALATPRGAERNHLFNQAREAIGFSEYDLHSFFNNRVRKNWIREHVSSPVGQKLATRAFDAVNKHAVGEKGRPRFKGVNQLDSIEGKSDRSAILWRDGEVHILGLKLKALVDERDDVHVWGLQHRVKFTRLVRRRIRGRTRYYAQLVLDGKPFVKPEHHDRFEKATVVQALDLGPSTIASVSAEHATLQQFLPNLVDVKRRVRLLQRKLDRSRRATNPGNYRADGTIKPGPKKWRYSNRYYRVRDELTELQRKLVEYRRTEHGRLSNLLLQHGCTIQTEDVSVKAWQRVYGRSIRDRAPGLFMELLSRKAESAGGSVLAINTRQTALSQHCICGKRHKKPLSERVHSCPDCGLELQRDLLSAYLALHVHVNRVGEHVLHASKAKQAFQGAEPLLRAAWQHATTKPANGRRRASTFGTFRSQSGSPEENQTPTAKAQHDVPHQGEGLGEAHGILVRTPRL